MLHTRLLRYLSSNLCLLLRRSLGLCGLLPVASNHNDAEEGTDNGRDDEDENYGDADGPDARGEEVLERVVGIDEGLAGALVIARITRCKAEFTIKRVQTV